MMNAAEFALQLAESQSKTLENLAALQEQLDELKTTPELSLLLDEFLQKAETLKNDLDNLQAVARKIREESAVRDDRQEGSAEERGCDLACSSADAVAHEEPAHHHEEARPLVYILGGSNGLEEVCLVSLCVCVVCVCVCVVFALCVCVCACVLWGVRTALGPIPAFPSGPLASLPVPLAPRPPPPLPILLSPPTRPRLHTRPAAGGPH